MHDSYLIQRKGRISSDFCIFSSKVNDFGRFRFEVRSKRFAFDIRAFMIDYCQKEYLDASSLLED